MNAYSLRSASAFARRSLATPPTIAPLSSSSARLLSSSSFTPSSPSSSQRSFSSALRLPRTTRIAASTRWSGSTSLYLTQSRTMASENTKIKVKNPVVELDGDEV